MSLAKYLIAPYYVGILQNLNSLSIRRKVTYSLPSYELPALLALSGQTIACVALYDSQHGAAETQIKELMDSLPYPVKYRLNHWSRKVEFPNGGSLLLTTNERIERLIGVDYDSIFVL